MARHRDIRNMNLSDEYDEYDEVYGHSVDDDYYISPSNRQFLYNRERSRDSSRSEIGDDIKEEDELEAELSDIDKAKLESVVEQIVSTIGPSVIPRKDLINLILKYNFKTETVLNAILEGAKSNDNTGDAKEKDVTYSRRKFYVPDSTKQKSDSPFKNTGMYKDNESVNKTNKNPTQFVIPNLTAIRPYNTFIVPKLVQSPKPKFSIPKLSIGKKELSSETTKVVDDEQFTTLSDLVNSHLKNSEVIPENKENTISPLTSKISKIKISELNDVKNVKSLTSIKDITMDEGLIDLSVALKNTLSLPVLNKHKKVAVENFEIPFIDISQDLPNDCKTTFQTCLLDISHIMGLNLKIIKRRSRFGRALCRNYRRPKPSLGFQGNFENKKIRKFNFMTPSPDDQIKAHIRR